MPFRILIMDDDVTIRRLLRRTLEERPGWEVCGEAAQGNDAIAQAEQLAPDLAIIDLAMRTTTVPRPRGKSSRSHPGLPCSY
jgi:DNA-binding NarL/FixJ family response regulator